MITGFDYRAMKLTADELIAFFGMSAVLRRVSAIPTDRPCTIAIVEFDPHERPNELANPTDRRVIMSAATSATPPDNELDALVTFVQPLTNPPVEDEVLRMTCKPKQTAPAGLPVLWEFTVR